MVMPKNIALWSHPRSMSTSVERCFRERGDCYCHHEPFMYFYYLEKHGTPYPGFDPEGNRPRQLDDIATMVSRRPKDDDHGYDHLFFKDMSYYIVDNLSRLMPVMSKLVSIFLIRDPRLSLASYGKLDPDFSLDEGGLEAQWFHLEALKKAGLKTLVIDAANISAHPSATMKLIWDFAEIPFIDHALSWKASRLPADWEQAKAWHQGSIESTGFSQPDGRDPDDVFETVAATMPILNDYLAHHQPFYDRLKEHAIKMNSSADLRR